MSFNLFGNIKHINKKQDILSCNLNFNCSFLQVGLKGVTENPISPSIPTGPSNATITTDGQLKVNGTVNATGILDIPGTVTNDGILVLT